MRHRAWGTGQGAMGMLASRRMAERQSREAGEHGRGDSARVRGRWSRSYDLANSINGFMLPLSASCIAEIYIFRVSLCSVRLDCPHVKSGF